MASKSTASSAAATKIPDQGQYAYPEHSPQYLFVKGVDAYETVEVGALVDLEQASGRKHKAVVSHVSVGPLIDLLGSYGSQAFLVYGRPYSAKGIVQAIARESGDSVLDVTKLYTAIGYMLQPDEPAAEA